MKILLLLVTLLPAVCTGSSSSPAPAITKTCLLSINGRGNIHYLYVAALSNTGKVQVKKILLSSPGVYIKTNISADVKTTISIEDAQGKECNDIIDLEMQNISTDTQHSFSLTAQGNEFYYNGEGTTTTASHTIAITTKHKDGTACITLIDCSHNTIKLISLLPH